MPLHRALPFYVLLLAACSAPPEGESGVTINPGPDCEGACAAGFRWAVENQVTSTVKCRGQNDFAKGCLQAVALAKPF